MLGLVKKQVRLLTAGLLWLDFITSCVIFNFHTSSLADVRVYSGLIISKLMSVVNFSAFRIAIFDFIHIKC